MAVREASDEQKAEQNDRATGEKLSVGCVRERRIKGETQVFGLRMCVKEGAVD